MDFHLHGSSPSSDDDRKHPISNTSIQTPNGHSSDPMHSWWESISRARERIHLLSSLLPPPAADDEDPLSSLADTDRPARSLLLSSAVYASVSAAVSSPSSGSSEDNLCHWLYDTYLSSDPDLRLVVLSYLPIVAAVYLRRIHHPASDQPVSLSGFEAVLLAVYSAETKARNGKPVTISIPDLSQPSLYHAPRNQVKSSNPNSNPGKTLVGVLSLPLEPQMAVKSTKRASIVGVVLDCYYKQISQMPSWSKLDCCRFAAVWAGEDCPCALDFDQKLESVIENGDGFGKGISFEDDEIESVGERVKDLVIQEHNSTNGGEKDAQIPLPWELLQPVLRILGHCLLGPLNADEVKDAASMAVRRMYARASHDLVPQAILATRSLIQLDKRARESAKAAVFTEAATPSGSNANTPSKAKKPEILLVSK
ncbi:hypothetical protein STAS_19523 [Striga asiatica]|uniref:Hyccin n=1 Tax=Striga asiatica TaxID=4170 RepID=A0A5A7QE99_STRAF|nr:hypothetical protein STAS_19523 [Striga asiatica]